MAQMTDDLARAILKGDGVTRNELEQLCRAWLSNSHLRQAALATEAQPPADTVTHEAHCNLRFPASLGTNEDYCDCKASTVTLGREEINRRLLRIHEKVTYGMSAEERKHFVVLGHSGEAGELANIVKKEWRGDDIPIEVIASEIADCSLYLKLVALEYGLTIDQCEELKMKELETRYPDDFIDAACTGKDE